MKILITGGTNGMGKGLALAIADKRDQEHEVILLCRSPVLGKKTLAELQSHNPSLKGSIVIADLCSMAALKTAVQDIKTQHHYLDGIFINAGIGYAASRVETIDGMDPHFQVNYLAQFYLVINLLELLERSSKGGRVIFNATPRGKINWEDTQMVKKWGYEKAIQQAMVAKRMLVQSLDGWYKISNPKVAFLAFSIHKTVWTNQVELIPKAMRRIASLMKALGQFISIETCGKVMAPLFLEDSSASLKKSGRFWTWKGGQ